MPKENIQRKDEFEWARKRDAYKSKLSIIIIILYYLYISYTYNVLALALTHSTFLFFLHPI